MNDALPLSRATRADPVTGRDEAADYRCSVPTRARMCGHADWLVDDHDVVVLVDDLETRDALGGDVDRRGRQRQVNIEPRTAAHPVRAIPAYSVEGYRPGVDQVRSGSARQPEQAGHRHIETQAVETVGHGDPSVLGPA
jgi:hypothetical protein